MHDFETIEKSYFTIDFIFAGSITHLLNFYVYFYVSNYVDCAMYVVYTVYTKCTVNN